MCVCGGGGGSQENSVTHVAVYNIYVHVCVYIYIYVYECMYYVCMYACVRACVRDLGERRGYTTYARAQSFPSTTGFRTDTFSSGWYLRQCFTVSSSVPVY